MNTPIAVKPGALALATLDCSDTTEALADIRALIAERDSLMRQRDMERAGVDEYRARWVASEQAGDHYVAEHRKLAVAIDRIRCLLEPMAMDKTGPGDAYAIALAAWNARTK